MAKDDKEEGKILDEVRKERESWAVFRALNEMGLNISEGFSPHEGIAGKAMKIRPVRIGMPGERDEGVIFGEPKRDTKYPIDSIKVINDKGQYYVEFLSSKAKGKPITYRKIDIGTEQQPTSVPEPRQKLLPPRPEQKLLPLYQEPKRLLPAKEQKLLPSHPEQKLLHPHPEQKLLPPAKEQKLLPPRAEPEPGPPPQPEQQPKKRKMYKVFIDSWPQRGAEIKFYYQQKRDITAAGIGPGSPFMNAVKNYLNTAAAARVVKIANDFDAQVRNRRISTKEDAERFLKGPLTAVLRHDVDYWMSVIIDSVLVPSPGFRIKEIQQGNNRTPITVDLEEGVWLLEAQASLDELSFDRWVATVSVTQGGKTTEREIGTIERDETQKRLRLVLNDAEIPWLGRAVEGPDTGFKQKRLAIRAVAYYKGTAKHADKPTVRSPYQSGTSPGRISAAKDSVVSGALGSSTARERRSWNVDTRDIKKDPYILAASNKGKRILNKYAKAEYSRIFDPLKREYRGRSQEVRQLQRAAMRARARLRGIITRNIRSARMGALRFNDQDTLNTASRLLEPGGALEGNAALIQSRDTLQSYLTARDRFYEDFKRDFESASAQLRDYLVSRAGVVSTMLARRYKMPVNSGDEDSLNRELKDYAVAIAEDFATKGRTIGHAMMRGLGIASRGLETGGAAFTNVFYNIFTFLLGPWTITSLFTLVLFYFTFIFVGYNVQILWIMPLIGAAITFLLNFSDTFRPLDWVTHMASGAIIGYSAALLLISLGAPNWNFIGGSNSSGFWIAWIVLGAIGLFQFYQTGGWKIVLQVGVLVLVFAYIALGPYHAYYDQAITQVKAPIEVAYKQVSNAITDVWLLVTNPTEWYARQQLVNARPERPLDYPKGVEFGSVEAMPPSVPQGQQFAVMAVVKNDGPIDASDVVVSYSCNSWCDARGVDKDSFNFTGASGLMDKGILESLAKHDGSSVYVRQSLMRGESEVITLSPFVASVFPQERGLTNFAKVGINVSYAYSTNSTLQADVISESELDKRFRAGDSVFAPVLAVEKGTPAKLSLNVGPQPLKEGTSQLLLVSISNTRDKSRVVLPRGTEIIISLPHEVGRSLECGSQKALEKEGEKHYREGYDTLVYKVEPTDTAQNSIEVLPYEFNSIFSFLCSFKANPDAGILKSGFITAELPRYIFRIEQTKDVPVTPRLGVVYDPWENVCSKIDDKEQCIKRKSGDDACYWSASASPGYIPSVVAPIGNDCHSCGPVTSRSCGNFEEYDCGTESGSNACNIACEWLTTAEMEAKGVTPDDRQKNEGGACLSKVSGTGKCEAVSVGSCSPSSLKGKCSWPADQASRICNVESSGDQYVESRSDICEDGNSFSVGLFQINVLSNGKLIEEAAGLATGRCQNMYTGSITLDKSTGRYNCNVKPERLDDFRICKNAAKDAETNIAAACGLYKARPDWGDWKNTRDKVCGQSLYKTDGTTIV